MISNVFSNIYPLFFYILGERIDIRFDLFRIEFQKRTIGPLLFCLLPFQNGGKESGIWIDIGLG